MELLKLIALDKDDIEVISTHLQDAILKVGDVVWCPHEKRLVVALNRFDWENAGSDPQYQRRRTALRFDRVLGVKCHGINPANPDRVLNLLAVEFQDIDPPGGIIDLIFSGGSALRLDIECLEAELADLGPVWSTPVCPDHLKNAL